MVILGIAGPWHRRGDLSRLRFYPVWMGGGKGRQRLGPLRDGAQARERGEVHAPAAGIVNLRDKAEVGKARCFAMAEGQGGALGEKAFEPV